MNIPYQLIDWTQIPIVIHPGKSGHASWQTIQLPGLRIRMVEYSAGYVADHWCQTGHIVLCLEGELITELESGEKYVLRPGMSYLVSDHNSSHRSVTEQSVKLFIMDGDFLK
ncbi:MAG: DHCW motif cupin fold protein [Saprospiraceae bacterium]